MTPELIKPLSDLEVDILARLRFQSCLIFFSFKLIYWVLSVELVYYQPNLELDAEFDFQCNC
ncbi:hypothetical protein J0J30_24335, partial [Vibrio vulnificus]|nr:hypothetical protein [Vibrio vulnificus]